MSGRVFNTVPRSDSTGAMILLQEVNHRVANDYTVVVADLALAAAELGNAEGRAALVNAQNRLRCLADAHRALQAPLLATDVDLASYLDVICKATAKARAIEGCVTLHVPNQEIIMSAERTWRIGLIIAELLTNAAKHGQPGGRITVKVDYFGHELVCRVANQDAPAARRGTGTGSAIVRSLAIEIGGYIQRTINEGQVEVELIAPLTVAPHGHSPSA